MHRLLCLLLCGSLGSLVAQTQRAPEDLHPAAQAPLQVELLLPLDANKLFPGAPIHAKARTDWSSPTCRLHEGSIVTGKVVALEKRSKTSKGSSLTLAFDHADCESAATTPAAFTLFAVVATPHEDEGAPMADVAYLHDPTSYVATGIAGRTLATTAPSLQATLGKSAKDPVIPASLSLGQVVGLKKVTLAVGKGLDGASVLTLEKGNLHLDSATVLILIPGNFAAAQPASTPKAPTTEIAADTPALPPPPPEIDETDVCAEACTIVPTTAHATASHATLTVATKSLGYTPHDTTRSYTAFGYESTVLYIDPQDLLFTYDAHTLRQRLPSGFLSETMRVIRAVLLDPATLQVKRMVDWQVQGEGQYLWRAARGEILVHIGHQLRLLGPNLETLRTLPVPGQLLYVSVAPDGNHLAVGVRHERHTRTTHYDLAQAMNFEPEEDVDAHLVDHSFSVLFTTRHNSSLAVPVLTRAGELRVNALGKDRWRVHEISWNRADRTIAKVTSRCRPSLATPLAESVFVVGCSESPARNWYRMIRLDGHPILTGDGPSIDTEQALGSDQGDFAVRTVRTQHLKLRGEPFTKKDLEAQEVSIYRAKDGKRLFFTASPGVSLAQQSFALSPDGAQVAILSDGALSLYPVQPQP